MGVPAKVIDFNIDFVDTCIEHKIEYNKLVAGITQHQIADENFRNVCNFLITRWAERIVAESPTILAISVFSHYGKYFTRHLCAQVKELDSKLPIILGGSGISNSIASGPDFAIELKNEGLIDYYIDGDAEEQWPLFLSTFFSLPAPATNKNYLNVQYSPDYSDYDISRYEKYRTDIGLLWVPVTGSKGCIRNCSFCEIPATWKFTQRGSPQIIAEVEAAVKIANNIHIHFTDSLVNGSMSVFDEILDGLVQLQLSQPNKFYWGGQFIIRQGKVDNWDKIKKSGCRMLEIGIETGSNDLRFEMNKKFTNNDLVYALQSMEDKGIQCVLLMFCSYPTETEEQFNETLNFFTTIQRYSSTSIRAVQLNASFCVFKDTPLYKDRKTIKLQTTSDPAQWICENNPSLTFKERVRRRLLLQEHLEKLEFRMASDTRTLLQELVPNYMRYRKGQQYTFDEMVLEVLGRPTTIKYRF